MTRRVVHCMADRYDVYIGRGADPNTLAKPARDWGNPFKLGRDGDRKNVCRRNRLRILQHPHLVDMARLELKDKTLGCWCAPQECHGDFLSEVARTVPVCHVGIGCTCYGENLCDHCAGLYCCKHCGGAEGALPSECPRVPMTAEQVDSVYSGLLNYIAGEWVEGCYDTSEQQNMPFWAGIIHVAERQTAPTEVKLDSLLITDR